MKRAGKRTGKRTIEERFPNRAAREAADRAVERIDASCPMSDFMDAWIAAYRAAGGMWV